MMATTQGRTRLMFLLASMCVQPCARGITLISQDADGVTIAFELPAFRIAPTTFEGEVRHEIVMPGMCLPNDAGAPNLPGCGRFLALPQNAHATAMIIAAEIETFTDVDILPAPVMSKEGDAGPLIIREDPEIYGHDGFYPEHPIRLSAVSHMRGVPIIRVGVTPFQYNPATRTLKAYRRIELRIGFHGGNGQFGEMRLRNRHWEPLLRQHILNYATLPPLEDRTGRNGCEYIILTPDDPDFIAWGDTLRNWRTLQGISTEVFTTTDIGGTSSNYLLWWFHEVYETWDPAPAAFLLLGDYPESGDARDTGLASPWWNGICSSDNMYADVDFDGLPEMVAARITARDNDELAIMINKLLEYEREPYEDPAFYDHPVISGAWEPETWFTLCSEIVYGFQENVLGKMPVREYAIYDGTPGTLWSTGANTDLVVDYFGPSGLGYIPNTPEHLIDWGGDAMRINADINSGAYFVLHRDHGNLTCWNTPLYCIDDIYGLTNPMSPFVLCIDAMTGRFEDVEECFAEAFHRYPMGALGLIAPAAGSYNYVTDVLALGIFDGLWPEFDPGYGDAIGSPDLRTAFAHTSAKFYLEASGWPCNPTAKDQAYHVFHHHGDAFTQINSEMPAELYVEHPDSLLLFSPFFELLADAGALIGLTIDGEIIGSAVATGGYQSIPIEPATEAGEMLITVTKANHYPYQEYVYITDAIYVYPDGSGQFPWIQAAVDAAHDGIEIILADGEYTGYGNRDVDFLGKAITIRSQSGNPEDCIINCEATLFDRHRGFIFQTGETNASVLADITVSFGVVIDSGGGVYCAPHASPSISNCIFANNGSAAWGGGLYGSSSDLILEGCTFTANFAGYGGGLALRDCSPNVNDCTFTDNQGIRGGGFYGLGVANPVVNRCNFVGNRADIAGGGLCCDVGFGPDLVDCEFTSNQTIDADGAGGGVYCDTGANANLHGTQFTDNTADYGGGLCSWTANLDLIECTFSGNSAHGEDGGGGALVFAVDSHSTLMSCTLVGNTSPNGGASGILCANDSHAIIDNTIVAFGVQGAALLCSGSGSAALTCCDLYANQGGDWIDCIADQAGLNGNLALNPLFCETLNPEEPYTIAILSPCAPDYNPSCGLIGAWPVACDIQLATHFVKPDGSGDYPTIQAAISAAAPGDTIELADGIFEGDGNRDVTYHGKPVVVRSQSRRPDYCVIDCGAGPGVEHRGFLFDSGEEPWALLEGVTITGGYVSGPDARGGGVFCDSSSSPTIVDCLIQGCEAQRGGGLACVNGAAPHLLRCTLSENVSAQGGGGFYSTQATPTFSDCMIDHNEAAYDGGGGYLLASSPIFTKCRFEVNETALGGGGGLYCQDFSSPVITEGTFMGNRAQDPSTGRGGGLAFAGDCNPVLTNCSIAANRTGVGGGGIYLEGGSHLSMDRSIIAYSSDHQAVGCADSSSAWLTCCDLFNNQGGDWVGCVENQFGINGNIDDDPQFCIGLNPRLPLLLKGTSPCAPENNPECGLIGAWPVGCESLQSIEEHVIGTGRLHLGRCVPNPFTATTRIPYSVPFAEEESAVALGIYDAAGRAVRTLVDGAHPPGEYEIIWDGAHTNGRRVAAGIYFYQLSLGTEYCTRRVLLVR